MIAFNDEGDRRNKSGDDDELDDIKSSQMEPDEIQLPGRNKNPVKNDPYRPKAKAKGPKAQKGHTRSSQGPTYSSSQTSLGTKGFIEAEASAAAQKEGKGTSESLSDDKIVLRQIETAIQEEESISENSKHVQIEVHDGQVRLEGIALSEQEKMTISDKAAAVVGFGRVKNEIQVRR